MMHDSVGSNVLHFVTSLISYLLLRAVLLTIIRVFTVMFSLYIQKQGCHTTRKTGKIQGI